MLRDELTTLAGHLWRRKVLVVLVALLFGAAGWYSAQGDETVYTSRAALTVSSGNHAPDQDAVLSQGYADFFNDGLYQGQMRRSAGVSDDVSFEASTGLASPLLYITATSTSSDAVAPAARAMADALRSEVNSSIRSAQLQEIADLKAAYEDLRETTGGEVPDQATIDLNDRIAEVTSDTSTMLQPVQLNSFVQATPPATATTTALGLGGGLFLGCVLAVLLGVLARRVETAGQLARLTDLPVLAEVSPAADPVADTQLWTVVRAERDAHGALLRPASGADDAQGATVVVVTSPLAAGSTAGDVAARLAEAASRTGNALLVDLRASTAEEGRGLADYVLDDTLKASNIVGVVTDSLALVTRGSASRDLYSALNDPRSVERLAVLRRTFDTIVITIPGVVDSAEALAACGLADDVLLVVDEGRSRTRDVVSSTQLLEAVVATPLRLVLVRRRSPRRRAETRRSGGGLAETSAAGELSRVP